MDIHVCVYTCTHIHIHIDTHTHAYVIHACMHACTHTLTDEGQGKSNQGRAACAREHTTAVLGSAGQGAGNWVQITGAAEACACAVVGGARLIDWLSVGSCVLGGNCTRVGALPRECPTRTAHSRACTRMHSLSLPLPAPPPSLRLSPRCWWPSNEDRPIRKHAGP